MCSLGECRVPHAHMSVICLSHISGLTSSPSSAAWSPRCASESVADAPDGSSVSSIGADPSVGCDTTVPLTIDPSLTPTVAAECSALRATSPASPPMVAAATSSERMSWAGLRCGSALMMTHRTTWPSSYLRAAAVAHDTLLHRLPPVGDAVVTQGTGQPAVKRNSSTSDESSNVRARQLGRAERRGGRGAAAAGATGPAMKLGERFGGHEAVHVVVEGDDDADRGVDPCHKARLEPKPENRNQCAREREDREEIFSRQCTR